MLSKSEVDAMILDREYDGMYLAQDYKAAMEQLILLHNVRGYDPDCPTCVMLAAYHGRTEGGNPDAN